VPLDVVHVILLETLHFEFQGRILLFQFGYFCAGLVDLHGHDLLFLAQTVSTMCLKVSLPRVGYDHAYLVGLVQPAAASICRHWRKCLTLRSISTSRVSAPAD
jgi:hypothetical protein